MIRLIERADGFLVETVDGFCGMLQTRFRIPHPLVLALVSYAAAAMAIAGSLAMFGIRRTEAWIIVGCWTVALVLMTGFVVTSLLPAIRRWNAIKFLQALNFATRMRVSTKPIRITTALATVVMALASLTYGDLAFAAQSIRYTFVSMVPICLMVYAYTSAPVPSPRILAELRELSQRK